MTNYVYIGTSEDIIELKYIKLSPDPPVPGEDLTVRAAGTVKETIEVSSPSYLSNCGCILNLILLARTERTLMLQ